MSVITAAQPQVAPRHLGADLSAVVDELGQQFYERRVEIEMILIAMLSKQHVFVQGPPGAAKTNLIEELCARFGLRFWSILMDRQLGKEDSFGPIDVPLYEKTGVWERDTFDTLVDADIAFVDEVGKAGPASLNPYLRAFNEREFRNGKRRIKLPLISAIGASNEYLEPELAAMWDRFPVRLRVQYLQEDGNFAKLISGVQSQATTGTVTTVDAEEFRAAIEYGVPAVTLPPSVVAGIVQLRSELRSEQVIPSDRRWKQSMRLLQASAYLGGRDVVDEDDVQVLQHVLWDNEGQIPTVTKKVLALTSPITKEAMELAQQLEEINQGVLDRKGTAKDKRAEFGGEAQFKVGEIKTRVEELTEKANREGRSTARLDAVRDQIKSVKVTIYMECLNLPADRAERMAGKA